jgi:hypothetical protein
VGLRQEALNPKKSFCNTQHHRVIGVGSGSGPGVAPASLPLRQGLPALRDRPSGGPYRVATHECSPGVAVLSTSVISILSHIKPVVSVGILVPGELGADAKAAAPEKVQIVVVVVVMSFGQTGGGEGGCEGEISYFKRARGKR